MKPNKVLIRKAVDLADLREVLRLYAQPKMDNGNVLSLKEASTIFERMQNYPNYSVYLACNNDYVIGTFALLIMDNLGHQGTPSGIIEDVVVDAEWHNQGIGKQMIQYAYEECQRAGCYKMMLSSNLKRTEAHAFYESIGLEKHGFSFRIPIKEKDDKDWATI